MPRPTYNQRLNHLSYLKESRTPKLYKTRKLGPAKTQTFRPYLYHKTLWMVLPSKGTQLLKISAKREKCISWLLKGYNFIKNAAKYVISKYQIKMLFDFLNRFFHIYRIVDIITHREKEDKSNKVSITCFY